MSATDKKSPEENSLSRSDWSEVNSILDSLVEKHPNKELDQVYGFRSAGALLQYITNNFLLEEDANEDIYAENEELQPLRCNNCLEEAEISDEDIDPSLDIVYGVEEIDDHRFDAETKRGYFEIYCRRHDKVFAEAGEKFYTTE